MASAHHRFGARAGILPALCLLLAGLVLLSLRAPAVRAADESVEISGFAFQPATVTIQVGDTVTWTNNDSTAHTATSQSGAPEAFDSGALDQGESFSFTFTQAGTYPYVCSFHSNMTGEIVVMAASASPSQAAQSSARPSEAAQASATPVATQLPDGAMHTDHPSGDGPSWMVVLGVLLLILGLGEPLLALARERRAV